MRHLDGMTRLEVLMLALRRAYQVGLGVAVFYYNAHGQYQSAIFFLMFFAILWRLD